MGSTTVGTDEFRRGPGFLFWLSWVVASLVGTILPLAWSEVSLSVRDLTAGLVAPPWDIDLVVSLATLGIAQALVLFPYFKLRGSLEWLAATIVGNLLVLLLTFVGLTYLLAQSSFDSTIFVVTLFPIVAVIVATLPQWFVLRKRIARAWVWVLTHLGLLLMGVILSPILKALPALALNIVLALITGVITGIVLEGLMRDRGPNATWDTGIKTVLRSPKKYREEAQVSPEELLERMRTDDSTKRS